MDDGWIGEVERRRAIQGKNQKRDVLEASLEAEPEAAQISSRRITMDYNLCSV